MILVCLESSFLQNEYKIDWVFINVYCQCPAVYNLVNRKEKGSRRYDIAGPQNVHRWQENVACVYIQDELIEIATHLKTNQLVQKYLIDNNN